jgi:hypothetical protein
MLWYEGLGGSVLVKTEVDLTSLDGRLGLVFVLCRLQMTRAQNLATEGLGLGRVRRWLRRNETRMNKAERDGEKEGVREREIAGSI